MEIFAYRPAPVVMHYMGFGATIGAGYVDYFLADLVISQTTLPCMQTCIILCVNVSLLIMCMYAPHDWGLLQHHSLGQVVATPELSIFYTEKLVYLPPSFYATSYR